MPIKTETTLVEYILVQKFLLANSKELAVAMQMPRRAFERFVRYASAAQMVRVQALLCIEMGAGSVGRFVHSKEPGRGPSLFRDPCPDCGYFSYISHDHDPWIDVGDHSFAPLTDLKECALCGVAFTRRELMGEESYQDHLKRIAEARRELAQSRRRKAR